MTEFNWIYKGDFPIKVRTFIMGFGVTRTLLKKIKFHGGHTLVNGQESLVNRKINYGDAVKLILPPEPENKSVGVSNVPINILFEDPNFLVVNKPAGVASVPGHDPLDDSLVNRVKGYYKQQGYTNQRIHIVTRLDKGTSGIVLFAKHHLAHSILDKQLKDKSIKKMYYAITSGIIKTRHFEIFLPIGRADDSLVKRVVTDSGKMSDTEGWVIKNMKDSTLIKVQLHTGRTHQIRVHMKEFGHPLIGDWLYNPGNSQLSRQALHCEFVQFFNPFSNRMVKVHAPVPKDMLTFIKNNSLLF